MEQIGRVMIAAGAALVVLGALLVAGVRLDWIGRLPGDILLKRRNFTFYFPVATSIVLSIVLTLIFWLFGRR